MKFKFNSINNKKFLKFSKENTIKNRNKKPQLMLNMIANFNYTGCYTILKNKVIQKLIN